MRTWLLLAIVVLSGCPKKSSDSSATASVTSSTVSAGQGDTLMHQRLQALTQARDDLVAGNADQARAGLRAMADDISPSSAPEGWQQPLRDLVEGAASGSESTTDDELARSIAEAGRACGSCHGAIGGGPTFDPVDVPGEDDVMGRHIWAADRMWESLITPDAQAWTRAREVLGPVDERAAQLYADVPLAVRAEAAQQRSRLHALAQAGTSASDTDRAEVYGAVLVTCVECHGLLGGGPR